MKLRALFLAPFLAVNLAACSPGESAPPPPPDPLPKPLATTPTPGAAVRREKTTTLTCLPELPPGAEEALLAIRNAAEAGDLPALRRWLAPELGKSFDSHPQLLRQLAAILDQGCLEDETGLKVTCPPGPPKRAGIARLPQGWRLTFFVAGD